MKSVTAMCLLILFVSMPFCAHFFKNDLGSASKACAQQCLPRIGTLKEDPSWIKPDNRKPVPFVCSCS